MALSRPSGLYPMLYAFFDRDGRLDLSNIARQIDAAIAARVAGIAILGLASEVGKLTLAERVQMIETAAAHIRGRVPLSVTVAGATPAEQIALVAIARDNGAAWVTLQPPPGPVLDDAGLSRFWGTVADATDLPVAVQHAPAYTGQGLSNAALAALGQRHSNIVAVKWEGSAVHIPEMIAETEGRLAVFNGRGGLEMPDNLRAGCAGMIPGIETIDVQASIFHQLTRGDVAAGEARYAEILPLLLFLMQSIDTFLCYGKRLAARRLGIGDVFDRAPILRPTPFGLEALRRHAAILPPLIGYPRLTHRP